MRLSRFLILPGLLLLSALASLAPRSIAAQSPGDSLLFLGSPVPLGSAAPLGSWNSGRAATAAAPAPLLDRPIERAEYRLGPGDVVNVSLFGDLDRMLTAQITPEGTLVLPSIGVVSVLGLDLDRAQERVRELVYRFYRNVQLELSLLQVRSFRVFLAGNVPEPGVREAMATTRLSELVPLTSPTGTMHRNIRIRRANGDSLRVDLTRFVQTGELEHNPLVEAGDAILVPTIDETVTLSGRVAYPGTYEYRPGETLAELLHLANGGVGFPSDAADSIRIARFTGAHERELHTLRREMALGAAGEALTLQPFDAIYVPAVANYKAHRTASVMGEVRRPGVYPIRPDTTTVYELIEMAGGFTEEASLLDAVLRRAPRMSPVDSLRLLQNIPPEFLSREERRIRQVTAVGDEGNVVVDFEQLYMNAGDVQSEVMQDLDVLFIPTRRAEVTVLGAVVEPGIVGHTPGATVREYIERAGGYSRRAATRDVVVIKARLGSRLDLKEAGALEPGDRIIVPFKESRTFLDVVQTTQGIISTISGVVLTVLAIQQIF